MAYSTTIPAATQQISDSQGDILENFVQLNTQFSVDHTALTAASNNGNHVQLTFPSAQTTKTASGTISYVYPKSDGTNVELYQSTYNIAATASVETKITSAGLPIWKGGTVGGTGVITYANGASGTPATSSANGAYLTLPNGIQLRWGTITSASQGSAITFGSAFSTQVLSLQLTVQSTTARAISYSSLTLNGFVVYPENSSGVTFTYFAIGN